MLLVAAGVWWALRPGDVPETAACPYPVVSSGARIARSNGDDRTTITAPSTGAVTVTETGFTQIKNKGEVSIGASVGRSAVSGIPKLCAAGDFTARALTFDSKLPKADLVRTELNVHCHLTPTSYLPAGPTQPVN